MSRCELERNKRSYNEELENSKNNNDNDKTNKNN